MTESVIVLFYRGGGTDHRGRSVAATLRLPVFTPSPQTTSTKSSGNVHSTSASIVR